MRELLAWIILLKWCCTCLEKKILNNTVFSLPVVKFLCQQTHTGAHLLVGIEVYLYVLACNMLKRVLFWHYLIVTLVFYLRKKSNKQASKNEVCRMMKFNLRHSSSDFFWWTPEYLTVKARCFKRQESVKDYLQKQNLLRCYGQLHRVALLNPFNTRTCAN